MRLDPLGPDVIPKAGAVPRRIQFNPTFRRAAAAQREVLSRFKRFARSKMFVFTTGKTTRTSPYTPEFNRSARFTSRLVPNWLFALGFWVARNLGEHRSTSCCQRCELRGIEVRDRLIPIWGGIEVLRQNEVMVLRPVD